MSAVRVRVYTDQFDHIQVEVDGRNVTRGTSVEAWVDNVDILGFVRQIVNGVIREIQADNVEVTE